MGRSHSGVGATRFASAVQYEHAMKRPCGPGPSRAAFCKPTSSLPGPAAAGSIPLRAVAKAAAWQVDLGRRISGLVVLYVM